MHHLLTPFLLGALSHLGIIAPASAQLPHTAEARITEFVSRAMEALDLVPGLSLAVVRGDDVVYERGSGWAAIGTRSSATSSSVRPANPGRTC